MFSTLCNFIFIAESIETPELDSHWWELAFLAQKTDTVSPAAFWLLRFRLLACVYSCVGCVNFTQNAKHTGVR